MISVSLSPLTTANSSPRSGVSIFLTVYIWLPRWLSILHDDKYHEFLRFRGWCPPPAVAGRPAGPRCTGGLLPAVCKMCKGGGLAPPCQCPPGWPDRHPQHGGQPECGKRDPVTTETPAEYFGSAQCQHPVGLVHANICVRRVGDLRFWLAAGAFIASVDRIAPGEVVAALQFFAQRGLDCCHENFGVCRDLMVDIFLVAVADVPEVATVFDRF